MAIEDAFHTLLLTAEGKMRPGIEDTPKRAAKAWVEATSGYSQEPKSILRCFEDGADRCDGELVLVSNIPVNSLCEHHLAPMFGLAHVSYIPDGKIVGLSKFARLVNLFARRLQVQERMTNQIADAVDELNPKAVGVVIQLRHLCMEQRGVKVRGSVTTTSALRGLFKTDAAARAEFFQLVDQGRNGTVI